MNEENQRRRTRRRERPVKKKKGRILAICLAALVLAGAVYGVHTWADYSGSFQSSAEVTVKIPSGSSGRQIAAQLAEDGIITHKTVFYYYMRMTGAGAGLKPGSYVLRVEMDEGDTLTFRFGAPLGEIDSDVDPQTGLSDVIRLQSGERRLNVDIGLTEHAKD